MNANDTLFMTMATPERDPMLYINDAANASVKECVRLLSDNPTSSIKKVITIQDHGVHTFTGYPYSRDTNIFHVMDRLDRNMNVKEIEYNVDTNAYEESM